MCLFLKRFEDATAASPPPEDDGDEDARERFDGSCDVGLMAVTCFPDHCVRNLTSSPSSTIAQADQIRINSSPHLLTRPGMRKIGGWMKMMDHDIKEVQMILGCKVVRAHPSSSFVR